MSVLLTAYNRERYIGAAIESVLTQTFTDFELVIVDDASHDNTARLAGEYCLDSRVRLVTNSRNLGQFENRNYASTLARGRYLKYHDSDDVMYPHCLETMVQALAAEPEAAVGLTRGTTWPGGPCPMFLTPRMAYQREFLGNGLFGCGPSGALFRTEAFHQLGGFPCRGVGSDYLFWLNACARHSVLLLPADLFWYRVHSGQEMQSPCAALDYALLPGEAWKALNASDCPLLPAERQIARRNLAYSIAKQCLADVRRRTPAPALHRLRLCGLSLMDWLRYLRRPQRSLFAGTPLDADGEFITPEQAVEPRNLASTR